MVGRVSGHGKLAGFALLGFMLAAAGCQSGNPLGALNLGGGQAQQPPAGAITAEELMAYCPSIVLRERDAVHNSYQRGGDGDASRLIYRATLSDSTRSCTYDGGMTNITIAVAGRVVSGPLGTAGTVSVPLRVRIFREAEVIHDQRFNHQIAVADTAGATQFMFTDNQSIPNPTSRNIRIVVGFEGSER